VPVIEIVEEGKEPAMYVRVEEEDVPDIIARHFKAHNPIRKLTSSMLRWTDRLYGDLDAEEMIQRHESEIREGHVDSFFTGQVHIATEHHGEMDPASLEEYLQRGGFMAVEKVLFGKAAGRALLAKHQGGKIAPPPEDAAWTPQQIIDEIMASGLRGRGGAGFPSGRKLQFVHDAKGDKKYILCNGDEGDPGAFMDRMILESYSWRVLEGMVIAALAVGADEGYLYIRAEYPLATRQVRKSIEECEAAGLLGDNIMGSKFSLKLHVKEGAGGALGQADAHQQHRNAFDDAVDHSERRGEVRGAGYGEEQRDESILACGQDSSWRAYRSADGDYDQRSRARHRRRD
jgi:NADH-quinone oxidoreductase subunit F